MLLIDLACYVLTKQKQAELRIFYRLPSRAQARKYSRASRGLFVQLCSRNRVSVGPNPGPHIDLPVSAA